MVTSRLLEAFLACPVKCYLLSEGEVPVGAEYSAWAAAREESYRRESFRKLISQETGPDIASTEPALWTHEVNTKAWRKALKRVGIEDFCWHDLWHTWASWHAQSGTPLHVPQELGG